MSTPRVRVLVVGAGFGGLAAAAELQRTGVADVQVLERADEVGGVWRDNTYPGAACDVPSSLYSWSWAADRPWGRRYAPQPEILDYIRDTAAARGLRDLVRTKTAVTAVRYDEPTRTWQVTTADGETIETDVVVSAVGQLSEPVVPDLPGRETFAGPAFHSAQWRHDVDLTGRRVVVVGTGASAIQFVPQVARQAAHVTVVQRSAPYVVPKPDHRHGRLYHRVVDRLPRLRRLERAAIFRLTEQLNAALGQDGPLTKVLRGVWRLHLRHQVKDPALRARLVPDYPLGCKRLLFSNDWYPTLDAPHVDVVTERIERIEPAGVRTADGVLHEADVLLWGTGFAATDFLSTLTVTGVGGRDLHEQWADGASAHLGVAVPGFPGFYCLYGPHTNLGGSSILGMLEPQARYVAQLVRRLAERPGTRLDVRPDVAAAFEDEMRTRLDGSVWTGCASWYRGDDGHISTNWPGRTAEYAHRLETVRWSDYEEVPA